MESCEETVEERQENEVEFLQAVYPEHFEDLRKKDPWKVHRPPEVKLHLVPQQSMSAGAPVYATLNLIIKCSASYPYEIPEFKLEDVKGLSNQQMSHLQTQLQEFAKTLKGEVMILEICQFVQTFLHKHNRPPSKSFYDEMIYNKKKQDEQYALEQQKKRDILKKKEEKKRQQIDEEIQKRQEALKEQSRRYRADSKTEENKPSSSNSSSSSVPTTPSSDSVVALTPIPKDSVNKARSRTSVSPQGRSATESGNYHRPERRRRTSTPKCDDQEKQDCSDHQGTAVIAFSTKPERTVIRGKCLGHGQRGSTVSAAMDTQTGQLLAVSEWVLKWRHVNRKLDVDDKQKDEEIAAKYLKQVYSAETELNSLLRLHHPNLVNYLAISYTQEQGKIVVNVLMEYMSGGSLQFYLNSHLPVQIDVLRYYTTQLLEALLYLHNKAVAHKDLRASGVFLDSNGTVKVADYSLDRRLADLYATVERDRPGVHFETERPQVLGRGGKKGDIYSLGIMLLSLSQGFETTETLPEVPTHFPADFQDFLAKCLIKDERHRWAFSELIEHSFVKAPLSSLLTNPKPLPASSGEKGIPNKAEEEADDSDTEIPFIPTSDASGQSRLTTEFEIIKGIGKGGFGDVIKVKNKLDGRFYAIKRIPLNPKSKLFTKKITREVKLLSRLNHENIVRYYNSWIETSEEMAHSDSSISMSQTDTSHNVADKSILNNQNKNNQNNPSKAKNSLSLIDDVEMNVPSVDQSVEWSISVSGHCRVIKDESSSDEDDDYDEEDGNVFGSFMAHLDSSDGIVFDHDENSEDDSSEESKQITNELTTSTKSSLPEEIPKLQFLYIQMEYCDKSTLRNSIDAGLYQDLNRVWRLFREIVEGLVHLHEQGMIHRDLKPVNIFLDSNDHVKIGDFGLATTDILGMQQGGIVDMTSFNPSLTFDLQTSISRSTSLGDGAHTGKVGTALYVSPEMIDTSAKALYSQKVDIYSLGVMFFEMCYRPLTTGMERIQILSKLRLPTIEMPDDFDEIDMPNQYHLIKLLLNHDPNKRPTSQELLQSEYLPPPQMEEAELNEVLRSTISNPNSKSYKKMIGAIFSQTVSEASDVTYDHGIHKGSFSLTNALIHRHVQDALQRIFQKHGALKISTPLLMPKSSLYNQVDQYVCFMDHSGGLVSLPWDLRIPFARYVAKNNISNLKRYNIEKVYREKKVFGSHPRELTECAFDIISSNVQGLVPDAEVLHVVSEIINEFPVLQSRNYYLRINHVSLIQAVLLFCGIQEEKHSEVLAILRDKPVGPPKQRKQHIQERLYKLSLTVQTVESLYNFIEKEGLFGKIASMLRCITKSKGQASVLAKKGLHEMETVLMHAETFGCKLQAFLSLGLIYNVQHYSGTIFQVAYDVKRKKKPAADVLAAGGRYDELIGKFKRTGFGVSQSGVGISLAYETLVAAGMDQEEFQIPSAYDILVCSLGHRPLVKEKLSVVKDLWAADLRAEVFHDSSLSQEEIQDFCKENRISHLVILKDLESGFVKIRSLEKDKVAEKKVAVNEITEFLVKMSSKVESTDTSGSTTKYSSFTSQISVDITSNTSSNLQSVDITFVLAESGKLASNAKRRYEAQIFSSISSIIQHISSKSRVEVLGLDLNSQVLRSIVAYLEYDRTEKDFENSIGPIIERHQRHRKYLTKIFDYIHELKFDKRCTVILLYGLKDDSYKLLM